MRETTGDFCSPRHRGASFGGIHRVATLRRHRGAYYLVKDHRCSQYPQGRSVSHSSADRAIHNRRNHFARYCDFAMGELLSLVLFSILGISVLLLRKQLRHRWIWRRDAPLEVASVGTNREHYGRVDVRNIRQSVVCDRHAARGT